MKRLLKDPIFLSLLALIALFLYLPPLRLLLPPVIGALIGYITNVLAVWMIFNPKRPVLGYVGVLPRRKRDIALRLGEMIERELVNPDSILRLLQSRRREIEEAIARVIVGVMEEERRPLRDVLGENYTAFKDFVVKVYLSHLNEITKFLQNITQNEKFFQILENLSSDLYSRIHRRSPLELLPTLEGILWETFLRTIRKLEDPEVSRRLAEVLDSALRESQRGRTEGFILTLINTFNMGYSRRKIEEFLRSLPAALERDPRLREEVREVLRWILNRPISDLFPPHLFVHTLLNLARAFVSEVANGERLLEILSSEGALEMLGRAVDRLFALAPSDVVERVGRERFAALVEEVVDGSFPLILPFIKAVIRKVDVQRIVVDRVMQYSTEEIEALVFGMMGKEFRFIEYMGIPIGALVGTLQLILMLVK